MSYAIRLPSIYRDAIEINRMGRMGSPSDILRKRSLLALATPSRAAGIFLVILCVGCAQWRGPAPIPAVRDTEVGIFTSSADTIAIDLPAHRLTIGSRAYELTDCSTVELRCFKNEDVGFHVAVPRSCRREHWRRDELTGRYPFEQISMIEHGDERQGRYVSTLGDRFSYSWFLDRGLLELRYDPTGTLHFGPVSPANNVGRAELAPYIYRLPQDRAFLRCAWSVP
jgi:hypothetical protein